MHKFLKRASLSIIAIIMGLTVWLAPMAQASTQSKFINKLGVNVLKVAPKYNLYGSVMMAQAITESGWGSSSLSRMAKNYYGIKGSYKGQSVSMRTAEYSSNGTLYYTNARFRKYPNVKASMTDNAKVLKNGTAWNRSYYAGAWRSNAKTYKQATSALSLRYSTNAAYGRQLNSIIASYHLHKKFDKTSTAKKAKQKTVATTNTAQSTTLQPRVKTNAAPKAKKYAKVTYSKKYAHAKYAVLTTTKHPLYNHVYNSRAGITTSKTTSLKNQVVKIKQKAIKQKTKTVWYYVTVNGQKGWIVGSALSKPTTKAKAQQQVKKATKASATTTFKSHAVTAQSQSATANSSSESTTSKSVTSSSNSSSSTANSSSTSTSSASSSDASNSSSAK